METLRTQVVGIMFTSANPAVQGLVLQSRVSDKILPLSATEVHKVGLSLQARSMLSLTKYVGKLHISRNKSNLVVLDLGKQLEKKWKDKLFHCIPFWVLANN